jgi:hypothetical protein
MYQLELSSSSQLGYSDAVFFSFTRDFQNMQGEISNYIVIGFIFALN